MGGARPPEPRTPGRAITLAKVARDARLTRQYVLLCVLSAAIATLGLLTNSTAVVIGAMLVSPLMSPIMALGFGLATFDAKFLWRGAVTLMVGVAVAVLTALIVVAVSPVRDVTTEIVARTRPNLLDLGVAIVGGLAGVFAVLARRDSVMVGVAIATALMPPLATVAFGFITSRPDFASGALLLFITNTAAIALSATAYARLAGFGHTLSHRQTLLQTVVIIGAVAMLAVPLTFTLRQIVTEARVATLARQTLQRAGPEEMQIERIEIDGDRTPVRISATVLSDSFRASLDRDVARRMEEVLKRPVVVTIAQLSTSIDRAQLESLQSRMDAQDAVRAEARRLAEALGAAAGVPATQVIADPVLKLAAVPGGAITPETRTAIGERWPEWRLIVAEAEPPEPTE